MNPGDEPKSRPSEERAPRRGLQLMAVILVAMALLAVYSNVQKAHVNQIETVAVKSPPFPGDSPTASPTPAAR